jgi:hypothetical protein
MKNSTLKAIKEEEDFIKAHEKEFMSMIEKTFTQLIQVSFTSKWVEVLYLDYYKDYVEATISIEEYLEWKQGLTSNP